MSVSRKVRLVDPECDQCEGTGLRFATFEYVGRVPKYVNCRCVEFMNPQSPTRDVHHHYGDRGECA